MSSIEKAIERLEKSGKSGSSPDASSSGAATSESASATPEAATEVRRDAGFVCRLNMEHLEKVGYLTPNALRTTTAEEYRMIKRPLLMNARGQGAAPVDRGNMIMITSALPGEGKTFNALNLAMSMAMERDSTVLLIDGDVVKPSLSRMLSLDTRPGLTDVLLDRQLDLGDVIVNTDLPKLKVIPAGRVHSHSTELLASEQMQHIANELSHRYTDRIIVFDTPPLLVTSQASVLAHLVGQILLVVEAGRTPQNAVTEAVSLLDSSKVIGMTLNKNRYSFNGDYYGGYYGYYGQ
ncbi:MAG: XrtA-associated tyrosine autokinase [Gammaproteobacteria bacterium]